MGGNSTKEHTLQAQILGKHAIPPGELSFLIFCSQKYSLTNFSPLSSGRGLTWANGGSNPFSLARKLRWSRLAWFVNNGVSSKWTGVFDNCMGTFPSALAR